MLHWILAYLFKLWRHRDGQNAHEKMFNIANWDMYRDFFNRSYGIFINSFHYRYCVDDLSPPHPHHLLESQLLGPSVQTFIRKDVVTLWVGYSMSCLPRQLKNFHGPFMLTFSSRSSAFGSCDLVCIHGIKLLTWSWNPVPFKEQAWKPGKTHRSWKKLCRETWNRMDLETWTATPGKEWQSLES